MSGYSNYRVVHTGNTIAVGNPVALNGTALINNTNPTVPCIGIAIGNGVAGEEVAVANDPSTGVMTRNVGTDPIVAGMPVFPGINGGVRGVVGPGEVALTEDTIVYSVGVARTNAAAAGQLLVAPLSQVVVAPLAIPDPEPPPDQLQLEAEITFDGGDDTHAVSIEVNGFAVAYVIDNVAGESASAVAGGWATALGVVIAAESDLADAIEDVGVEAGVVTITANPGFVLNLVIDPGNDIEVVVVITSAVVPPEE